MTNNCRNCKFSLPVNKETAKKSTKLRAVVEMTGNELAGKPERKAELKKLKDRPEYDELKKAKGLENLTEKSTDQGSVYITCQNEDHLKDEGSEKPVVHKYYYSCPYGVARK